MKRALFYQILSIVIVFNYNGLYGQEAHEHEHAQTGMSIYGKREEQDQVRMYWQMPNRVLDEIGVDSGQTIADVGCGIGYFSIPGLTGDQRNPEVFIKIVDGTDFNDRYWIFHGTLSAPACDRFGPTG